MRLGTGLLATLLVATAFAGCIASPTGLDPAGLDLRSVQDLLWDTTGNFSKLLHPGSLGVLPVEKAEIPSVEGTTLASALWRPDVPEGERVPVILTISPYFQDYLYEPTGWAEDFFLASFVPKGYAYGRVALQGTSYSGGCMETMSANEQQGIDDAVTWYGEQPWSNGHVAVIGLSYFGTTPWVASSYGNPHLKTIVPIAGITSWGELGFRNGTSEVRGPFHMEIYWTFYGLGLSAGDPAFRAERWPEQVCTEVAEGHAASLWAASTGETTPGPFAAYWEERDFRQRILDNYEGSVFVVHGLQDWNVEPSQSFPFVSELVKKGLEVKVLAGQWTHTFPDGPRRDQVVRWDFAEMLLAWFDKHLKGLDVDTGPAVWAQDSLRLWRTEAAWPPEDAARTDLHLGGEGTLEAEPTEPGESYAVNPLGAADDRRCLGTDEFSAPTSAPVGGWTFRTAPFEEGVRFAGLPQAHVTVAPGSPRGGVLAAELWDVAKSGAATRVGHGDINLRFHAGGSEPQTLTPGQPVLAVLEFEPLDVALLPGHALLLRLVPDAPNGPCGGNPDTLPTANVEPMRLEWGEGKSMLFLPIIERDVGEGKYPGQPAGTT